MSNEPFDLPETDQPIVYIRSVKTSDLPRKIRKQTGGLDEVYAIHSEDGEYLGLAKDRTMAFVYAKQNDLAPVSVH